MPADILFNFKNFSMKLALLFGAAARLLTPASATKGVKVFPS